MDLRRSLAVLFLTAFLVAEHPVNLIQRDLEKSIITEIEAVELKTRAVLMPGSLPGIYIVTDPTPLRCGAMIIQEAIEHLEYMPEDLKDKLNNPLSSFNSVNRVIYNSPGGLFRISYQTSGNDAVSTYDGDNSGVPDYIEDMGDYFDTAIGWVTTNGWNHPLDFTGNSQFYVTVENLSGIYGYVPGNSYHQIWMDNSLSDRYNKLTSCHELFHLVQHTYNVSSSWFKEASSMWIEEKIYDALDGYEGYESGFQTKPHYSLDTFVSGELYQYGAVLWNFYLEENFGNQAIQTIWEKPYGSAITAANSYLQDNNSSITEEFPKFVAWNYFTGYRSGMSYEGGEYEEADNFTPGSYAATYNYAVSNYTPSSEIKPDHLGCNYVKLNRSGASGHLVVEFDGEANRNWNLQIFIRQGSDYDGEEVTLDSDNDALYVLNNWGSYTSVTVSPTVLNTSGSNANYTLSMTPVTNLVLINDSEINVTGGNNDNYPDPGETVYLTVTFINYGNPVYNATASLTTSNSDITINDGSSSFSYIGTNETASNSSDPFEIAIDANASFGTVEFTISLNSGATNLVTDTWSMNVGLPAILLVDDDNGADTEEAIVEALDALDDAYELKDRTEVSLDDLNLNARNLVIWNTGGVGATSPALSSDEQSVIKDFLDAGKNLFLVGDHLAQQLESTELLEQYLDIHFGGTRSTTFLKGTPDDPIGINNSSWIILAADFTGIDSVNSLGDPRNHISFYINGDDDHGGIMRYSSSAYRAVTASFGIDKVSASNANFMEASDVVTRVLEYLLSEVSYPNQISTGSPATGSEVILDSDDDALSFDWSGEQDGVAYTLFFSESGTAIRPFFTLAGVSGNGVDIGYQDFVDHFGYVDEMDVHWGIYGNKDQEVSVSELQSLSITISVPAAVGENEFVPTAFAVSPNYPNPFNPVTNIDVNVPEYGFLEAVVHDLAGSEIDVLAREIASPGMVRLSWTGKDHSGNPAPSGVYLLTVRFNDQTRNRKLVLMK